MTNQSAEFRIEGEYRYDLRSPLRWISSHLFRYPVLPILFTLSVAGMSGLQSWGAVLIGQAFDAVSAGGGTAIEALSRVALLLLVARLGYGLLDIINSYSRAMTGQRLERDAREELYISLLGKSLTFHNRQRVGDIMSRATGDVQQLNAMISPGASLIIESIVTLIVPFIVIASIRVELLITPILFLVFFIIALTDYAGKLGPVAGALRGQFGQMNAALAETVSGIEVVKGYAQEPYERERFTRNATAYRDLFVREGDIQARYLPFLLYGILIGLGFGHALYLYGQGVLTVGEVIGFMSLLEVLRFPVFISLFTFALVQLGLASAKRITTMIQETTDLDENVTGHSARITGAITFRDVTFGYGAAPVDDGGSWGPAPDTPAVSAPPPPVLSNISFNASPGETIAIVGQTGAGKTTLTRLVNRIYDVEAGQVLVDDVDVREWNLDSLRSQISTIEQDIFLFSRSIAENIAFGARGEVTRAQIEEAARQAQAHDFIASFPEGYDTVVGERGVTLSGGQRQRVAIARAFLTDPRILVLDDSTSAIDSATEDEIQRAMRRILTGRTTLLITHRISQIRWADRILLLKNGRLIASGTHDELLAGSEAYRRIFVRDL